MTRNYENESNLTGRKNKEEGNLIKNFRNANIGDDIVRENGYKKKRKTVHMRMQKVPIEDVQKK